jgi:hypothetical protein
VSSGHYNLSDRYGWPVDFLSDYLFVDWAAEDETNPLIGSTLTESGTVITDLPTPLVDSSGVRIVNSRTGGGGYTGALDATGAYNGTDDIVIITHFGLCSDSAITHQIAAYYGIGTGVDPSILLFTTNNLIYAQVRGAADTYPNVSSGIGWHCLIFVYDADGNSTLYANGNTGSVGATALSSDATMNVLFGVNTADHDVNITRTMMWKGSGIADLVTADKRGEIYNHVMGVASVNGSYSSFTRNSVSSTVRNSRLSIVGADYLAAGDSDGIQFDPAIENKSHRNFDPSAVTGLQVTGGMTLEVVADDNAALSSAVVDIRDLGPSVFRVYNDTGGTQYVSCSATVGNTNR